MANWRARIVGAVNPGRVAKQIYMHLTSFGEPRAEGGFSLRWTHACAELEAQLGAPVAMSIMGVVARFPMIEVDFARDELTLRDPGALRLALAELG